MDAGLALCGYRSPDEGPPTAVEPGAAAGAWGFGRAGVAQVDQYAIVYVDEPSAQAAVARAQAQVEMCTDAITGNPEYVGDPPAIEVGTVPSSVEGFRVRALFTHETGRPMTWSAPSCGPGPGSTTCGSTR